MPESSREEIAKLEALYANNPEGRVFTHLAEALRKAGELERARTILEDGIAKHPTYASAHVVLGRVQVGLSHHEEAAESFRRVLSLDPHNLIALRSLGDIARSAGRAEEAIGYFEQLKHHDPNNAEIDGIITELSARPAPVEEAPVAESEPAPDFEHEPPAAQERAFDEPALEEPVAAGASAPEPTPVSNDIDLDWVPDIDSAFDSLPGDLASLTAAPQVSEPSPAAAVPEPPPAAEEAIFDLPDGIGDMALDAALGQASEESVTEEVDFGSTSLDSDFVLPTFDDDSTTDEAPFDVSFEAEPPLEAAFEPEAMVEEAAPTDEAETYSEPEIQSEPEIEPEPEPETEPEPEPLPTFESAFEQPPVPEPEPEPEAELEEEPAGEVVTETIAELYASQGLHDRAADVYRALLRQHPGDAALEAKLRETESRAAAPASTGWDEAFYEEPAPEPEPESEPDAEAWIAGGAGATASAPTPYAWEAEAAEPEAQAGPPIGDYFRKLLSWKPSAPAPVASARPSEPEPVIAAAPAEPEAAAEPISWSESASAPETDAEDPLLLLEDLAPPPAEEPPAPPPPLTAATVVAPEPLPWEAPSPASQAPAPPTEPTPTPAFEPGTATTPEAAFDEWFGGPEEQAAPPPQQAAAAESASPSEGEAGGEDDDDLEMFRSWLQSLKK